jgi:hypothetical protein
MVQTSGHGIQTGFNIPQAFPVSQLGKCEAQKLIQAGEVFHPVVTIVAFNTLSKLIAWKEIHDLGEYRLAFAHHYTPFGLVCDEV